MTNLRATAITVAALAVIGALLPNDYYCDLATRMAFNACIAIALNLLIGYTGQISLGHACFFGLGAYASAYLTTQLGWPALAGMAAGAAGVAVLAWLVGRPILQLKGHYLAMATLGLGIVVSIVLTNESGLTGGPDGMAVGPLGAMGVELTGERAWYALAAIALVLMTHGARNLVNAPGGRALQAIHGSEIGATVVGVDVSAMKLRVFVLSATVASLVGSLQAHHVGFVTPGISGFTHSIELVTMVIIGGAASVYGSIVGAVLMTLLPQALSTLEGWETVALGFVLVSCMVALPGGLVPTMQKHLRARMKTA